MIWDFLIDKLSMVVAIVSHIIATFVESFVYIATMSIVVAVKNLPTIIILTTIICLFAVIYAGFEYFFSRVAPGGRVVQYRPRKTAVMLEVFGAVAIAICGIAWNAGSVNSTQ